MKISKNKKNCFFSYVPRIIQPKKKFLDQKVCPVARIRTDRRTDTHESDYWGHPFRVSGFSFNLQSRIGPTIVYTTKK